MSAGDPSPSPLPALGVQGSLFPDLAPVEPESVAADPSSADEGAAAGRSNRRRIHPGLRPPRPSADGPEEAHDASVSHDPGDDLPRWHRHDLVPEEALTPMLRHYVELKSAHPERVLLYRLGDFFECFFEDALLVSRTLELTLTGKDGGRTVGRVPMAGIPHHAAERYCAELVRGGHAVALCDQLETVPSRAGALLQRAVTRVLTPGTVLEEGLLPARSNNWLAAAVAAPDGSWGLAVADVSTGEFRLVEGTDPDALRQELQQLEAAEVLLPGDGPLPEWLPERLSCTRPGRTAFERGAAERCLRHRFGLATLDGLGLGACPLALRAAGGLVAYLDASQPGHTVPLDQPLLRAGVDALAVDPQTRRNLELTATQRDGQFAGSLLWAIDRSLTAMGARCLRRWLEAPLLDLEAIEERQEAIALFVDRRPLRQAIRRLLRPMGDLERLAGRCAAGSAAARDLNAIADGLERLPALAELLAQAARGPLAPLADPDRNLEALAATIRHRLVEQPPSTLLEGGLIHDGVDDELDDLRNRLDEQQNWLAEVERRERQASGNANLRLQFHRSFGYFLSVSRARAARVPDHWIRRQTLSNEERFVTPELKEREGRILQLRSRCHQREYDLFSALRTAVGEQAAPIRAAARGVAALDALCGLAELAATQGYCRPRLERSRRFEVSDGRHPVVEQLLVEASFVANDVALGSPASPDLIVLTGPNASGKSCYLRQIGVLQLLAQMGSWVPARSACIGLADRVFTRVGAVDDLASGQSTFLVEMAETANILRHASDRSLVLLDEIGRGTATFDGLSIAWAVAEHLAQVLRARTVFATHYHELNALAAELANVANAQVLVEEHPDGLRFLHRVIPGGASRSYGIEVARLAGVPSTVVSRAREVLRRIEAGQPPAA